MCKFLIWPFIFIWFENLSFRLIWVPVIRVSVICYSITTVGETMVGAGTLTGGETSPLARYCPSVVMILYPYDNDTVPPSINNTVALYRKLQGKKSYSISPNKIPKPLIFWNKSKMTSSGFSSVLLLIQIDLFLQSHTCIIKISNWWSTMPSWFFFIGKRYLMVKIFTLYICTWTI